MFSASLHSPPGTEQMGALDGKPPIAVRPALRGEGAGPMAASLIRSPPRPRRSVGAGGARPAGRPEPGLQTRIGERMGPGGQWGLIVTAEGRIRRTRIHHARRRDPLLGLAREPLAELCLVLGIGMWV
jgi:hypothetical protein